MYVTCEDKCFEIMGDNTEEVPELRSCQEEADTRLLLHAADAANEGYDAMVISSEDTDELELELELDEVFNRLMTSLPAHEDTDVFVLLLAFYENINTGLSRNVVLERTQS